MSNTTNSNAVISKWKNIFLVFCCISGVYITFGLLRKRRWPEDVISFWRYSLQNARLLKCIKIQLSAPLWTVNMLNGPKDCLILPDSIFVIFFDHYWKKITSEDSVLVVSDILRLFVNILTPNDKYSLAVKASL